MEASSMTAGDHDRQRVTPGPLPAAQVPPCVVFKEEDFGFRWSDRPV